MNKTTREDSRCFGQRFWLFERAAVFQDSFLRLFVQVFHALMKKGDLSLFSESQSLSQSVNQLQQQDISIAIDRESR